MKTLRFFFALAIVFLLATLSSCSSSSSSDTTTAETFPDAPDSKMIVTIDGKLDTLNVVTVLKTGDNYHIAADAGPGKLVALSAFLVHSPGTYGNVPPGRVDSLVTLRYIDNTSSTTYYADQEIGLCSCTITRLDSHIVATFYGTLQLKNASGTMTISKGRVHAILP